jgi:hypothetical protein
MRDHRINAVWGLILHLFFGFFFLFQFQCLLQLGFKDVSMNVGNKVMMVL